MLRDETAGSAAIEVLEEAEPALSLEDLVAPSEPHVPERSSVATEMAEAHATSGDRSHATHATLAPGLRTARVVAVDGRRAKVALRGSHEALDATLAPEVEGDLVEEAAAQKDSVLVEIEGDGAIVVVGLVQTRRAREVRVTGEKIVIEAEREVLLRAGRAALRLREDGDVELVGSRISAASRGLFRIVGRILRLN